MMSYDHDFFLLFSHYLFKLSNQFTGCSKSYCAKVWAYCLFPSVSHKPDTLELSFFQAYRISIGQTKLAPRGCDICMARGDKREK